MTFLAPTTWTVAGAVELHAMSVSSKAATATAQGAVRVNVTHGWEATSGDVNIRGATLTLSSDVVSTINGDVTLSAVGALTMTEARAITSAGAISLAFANIISGSARITAATRVNVTGDWVSTGEVLVTSVSSGLELNSDITTRGP